VSIATVTDPPIASIIWASASARIKLLFKERSLVISHWSVVICHWESLKNGLRVAGEVVRAIWPVSILPYYILAIF
jgi:hypothetical protein